MQHQEYQQEPVLFIILLYSLNGSKFQTSNTFTVTAGVYVLIVADQMSNQFTLSGIIVGQPSPLGLKLIKETNASSKTSANGSFTVSGTGGTPAYQYSKNSGANYQSSGTFSNLAPGTYKISVKDANNCAALNILTVTVGYGKSSSAIAETMTSDTIAISITAAVFPN